MALLEFTPLEFETKEHVEEAINTFLLEFTPLEFETASFRYSRFVTWY